MNTVNDMIKGCYWHVLYMDFVMNSFNQRVNIVENKLHYFEISQSFRLTKYFIETITLLMFGTF